MPNTVAPPPRAWLPRGHALIIGATGLGKTVRLRAVADAIPRWVYIAPMADPKSWPVKPGEVLIQEHEQGRGLFEFAEACAKRSVARFIVEARPGVHYATDVAAWAEVVLACGDTYLIIDELEEVLAGEEEEREQVIRILWRGRKVGSFVIAAAHRPLGIPRAFTSQGAVIAFRTHEPADLEWFRKAGLSTDRIEALGPFEALVREPGGRPFVLNRHGQIRVDAPSAAS